MHMPEVVIIKPPPNTPEQEKKILKRMADVLGLMAEEKYGFYVEYELRLKKTSDK